jgi:membrane-associated protein
MGGLDADSMDLAALASTPLLSGLLLAGLVAFDAVFPAVPSDAFVVSAGTLAAAGTLSLGWVVVAVVTGAMVGDHIVYWSARHALPGVLERSHLGRRVRASVDRAYGRIEGFDTVTLAMARFIPFGRTAAAATAGLVGIPPRRFVWISLLGASTWATWMVGLGYILGDTMVGPMWVPVVIGVAVGFVVAAGLAGIQQAITRRRSLISLRTANGSAFSEPGPSPASRP